MAFFSVGTKNRSQRMLEIWFEISFNVYPSRNDWINNKCYIVLKTFHEKRKQLQITYIVKRSLKSVWWISIQNFDVFTVFEKKICAIRYDTISIRFITMLSSSTIHNMIEVADFKSQSNSLVAVAFNKICIHKILDTI